MAHSELYIKNMEILKENYTEYAEHLEKEECGDLDVKSWMKETGTGRLVLTACKDNIEYLLESEYDNDIYQKKFFQMIPEKWELNGKLFLFGLGNGMYVKEFLDRFSNDHIIFVYEPSESVFRNVIEHYDITEILSSNRVKFYLEGDFNKKSFGQVVSDGIDYTDLFTYKYGYYTNYVQLFPQKIDDYIQMIEDVFCATNGDRSLYVECGEMFLDNNYNNYKYLLESKSIQQFVNSVPENVPAFIVSTGPSLNKNIDELKRVHGHGIIIAVDASIDVLSRKGIPVDIMIAIDPTKGEDYLKEEASRMVPLSCELNTAKGFLETHKGPKFFSLSYNGYSNLIMAECGKVQYPLSTGGSVANSAFSLAELLGCRTIVLVGQDLAFTGDKTHAEGSVRGEEGKEFIDGRKGVNIVIEDIYGNPVTSCVEYRRFKIWFENRIKLLKDTYEDMRVIDATEGGAKINGTEIRTLRETIDELCTEDYSLRDKLEEAEDFFTKEEKLVYIDHLLKLKSELEDNLSEIDKLQKIYDELEETINSESMDYDKVKKLSKESIEQLNMIEQNKAIQFVNDISSAGINDILSRVFQTKSDLKEELLSICEIGREHMGQLEKGIDKVMEIDESNRQMLLDLRSRYTC